MTLALHFPTEPGRCVAKTVGFLSQDGCRREGTQVACKDGIMVGMVCEEHGRQVADEWARSGWTVVAVLSEVTGSEVTFDLDGLDKR